MVASKILVVVLAGGLFGSGCVSWYSGSARRIDPFPTPEFASYQGQPRKIGIDLTLQQVGAYTSIEARQNTKDLLNGLTQDIFEKTGYFRLSLDNRNAQYILRLHVRDDVSASIPMAILSGLTFTMIPTWATDEFTIMAELQDSSGNPLAEKRIKEELHTLFQFFMIFGTPFSHPMDELESLWRDVSRDLAVWCYQQIELNT